MKKNIIISAILVASTFGANAATMTLERQKELCNKSTTKIWVDAGVLSSCVSKAPCWDTSPVSRKFCDNKSFADTFVNNSATAISLIKDTTSFDDVVVNQSTLKPNGADISFIAKRYRDGKMHDYKEFVFGGVGNTANAISQEGILEAVTECELFGCKLAHLSKLGISGQNLALTKNSFTCYCSTAPKGDIMNISNRSTIQNDRFYTITRK